MVSRRARKNFPKNSQEINADLGEIILDTYPEMKVDVHHPDIMLNVEIRSQVNIYSMIIPGPVVCRLEQQERQCCFCPVVSTARWQAI